jgi:hypothetical protein
VIFTEKLTFRWKKELVINNLNYWFFFVDPDSSKLDLSKELANDFSNPFDSLIDASVLQHLNTDDDFVSKLYF